MSEIRRIQIRRDSAINWTTHNPTLRSGELGLNEDNGRVKIGDASTPWSGLMYLEDNQLSELRTEYGNEISFQNGVTWGENN
jgi:hypothetical protein